MSTKHKIFTISGMTCFGCVNSLTKVLSTVPGVEVLRIDIGTAQLRVDAERVTSQIVKDAVGRAGFEVTAEQ